VSREEFACRSGPEVLDDLKMKYSAFQSVGK